MGGLKQSLLHSSTYSLKKNCVTNSMGVTYIQVLPI